MSEPAENGESPSAPSEFMRRIGRAWNRLAVRCGRDPRWYEADDWRAGHDVETLRELDGGFHVPARACPQGHIHEGARAELLSRASIWGQARLRAHFVFETETCTVCGSRLIERCGRCRARIVEPVEDRCRACGLPQPWSPDRLQSAAGARARRWKEGDSHDPAVLVREVPGGGSLFVIEGDITSIAVDCVLSNDDVDGRMYTVIASAIKAAAGPDVERQSLSQGPFRRGEAWHTDAGSLPSPIRAVIHVAAMDRRGDTDRKTIRMCVTSALDAARKAGMTSIAIAAFGTGPRGFGPKVIDIDAWLADVSTAVTHRLLEWQREALAHPTAEQAGEPSPTSAPDPLDAPDTPPAGDTQQPAESGLDVLVVLYEPLHFDELVERLREASHDPPPTSGEARRAEADDDGKPLVTPPLAARRSP
jgi:O-acetyl-ADP-ribose deacetylase (regulator of RNase III)